MKMFVQRTLAAGAALIMAASFAACGGEDTSSEPAEETSSVVSAAEQPPEKAELEKQIVGNWGRLGEIMHIFYDDGTCLVGGVHGIYEIAENGTLVMTTMGGTKIEYVWNDTRSVNNWKLADNTLTVNGNEFSRIIIESDDEPSE